MKRYLKGDRSRLRGAAKGDGASDPNLPFVGERDRVGARRLGTLQRISRMAGDGAGEGGYNKQKN
ncbi:MAG: hypothetical protein ACRDH9_01310 [Actinomycetota bacterium]